MDIVVVVVVVLVEKDVDLRKYFGSRIVITIQINEIISETPQESTQLMTNRKFLLTS